MDQDSHDADVLAQHVHQMLQADEEEATRDDDARMRAALLALVALIGAEEDKANRLERRRLQRQQLQRGYLQPDPRENTASTRLYESQSDVSLRGDRLRRCVHHDKSTTRPACARYPNRFMSYTNRKYMFEP
jgi:hypothetical protein